MPGYDAPTLAALLAVQRTMTPIGRFAATWNDRSPSTESRDETVSGDDTVTSSARLSLTNLQPGEQYAFEVDLDACSGCKACVSACHHLNGLDEGETWRSVGLLISPGPIPVLQHVTTACHHCLDPACLAGCPTNAYEKDPQTGIVRHLDDQCFGCQYCTMTCPYDVPQYHAGKGIVRKCDLCHDRLLQGEAPACVQSCPNEALRIVNVSLTDVVDRAANETFLPGAPSPRWTIPTTHFVGGGVHLSDAIPASRTPTEPQHAHLPLVCLLVMTQGSVGGFLAAWLLLVTDHAASSFTASLIALAMAMVGLVAAPLHLGRPRLAYRAVLGWRHSWMSREAIALGVMVALGLVAFALGFDQPTWLASVAPNLQAIVMFLTSITGCFAVYCSIRIYQVTQRVWWRGSRTAGRFWLTLLLMGLHLGALSLTARGDAHATHVVIAGYLLVTVVAIVKLCWEHYFICHAREHDSAIDNESLAASQSMVRGVLGHRHYARLSLSFTGGIVLPLMICALVSRSTLATSLTLVLASTALLTSLLGELCERTIYFQAVVPMTMPRSIG